jgi:hypothetical protein
LAERVLEFEPVKVLNPIVETLNAKKALVDDEIDQTI